MRITTKDNHDGTHHFYLAQLVDGSATGKHQSVDVASDDPRWVELQRLAQDLADNPVVS